MKSISPRSIFSPTRTGLLSRGRRAFRRNIPRSRALFAASHDRRYSNEPPGPGRKGGRAARGRACTRVYRYTGTDRSIVGPDTVPRDFNYHRVPDYLYGRKRLNNISSRAARNRAAGCRGGRRGAEVRRGAETERIVSRWETGYCERSGSRYRSLSDPADR